MAYSSCQMSSSSSACTATTLQQSMTEPPPTARMSVTPCSRASVAPSWALAYVGFGMMPLKSTTVLPAASSWPRTWSYGPLRLMEPPSNASITTSPMRVISASSAYAVVPSPKWTRVGGTSNRTESYASPCDVFCGCVGRVRRLGAEGPQPRFAVRRSLACGLSVATGSNNRSSVSASKYTSIMFSLLPTSANRSSHFVGASDSSCPNRKRRRRATNFLLPESSIAQPRAWAVGVFSASAHFVILQWGIVLVGQW